jgi:hypothetical protein
MASTVMAGFFSVKVFWMSPPMLAVGSKVARRARFPVYSRW